MEVDLKKSKSELKFVCDDIDITKRLIAQKLIRDKKFFVIKENMIILNKTVIILYTKKQAMEMVLEEENKRIEMFKKLENSFKLIDPPIIEDKDNEKIKYKRYNDNSAVNQRLKQSTLLIRKRVIKYDKSSN